MRDWLALIVALFLLVVALGLAAALHVYRRSRQKARRAAAARGRTIVAELPVGPELLLVTEDATHFYYGDRPIEKRAIRSVRVLINGEPIAIATTPGVPQAGPLLRRPEERTDGFERDRWDVLLELESGEVLIECGTIRERVSRELARRIFDAVRRAM